MLWQAWGMPSERNATGIFLFSWIFNSITSQLCIDDWSRNSERGEKNCGSYCGNGLPACHSDGIIEAYASRRISIDWLDHSTKYLLIEFVAEFDFSCSFRIRLYYFNKDVIIRRKEIEYFGDDDCRLANSLHAKYALDDHHFSLRIFNFILYFSGSFNLNAPPKLILMRTVESMSGIYACTPSKCRREKHEPKSIWKLEFRISSECFLHQRMELKSRRASPAFFHFNFFVGGKCNHVWSVSWTRASASSQFSRFYSIKCPAFGLISTFPAYLFPRIRFISFAVGQKDSPYILNIEP